MEVVSEYFRILAEFFGAFFQFLEKHPNLALWAQSAGLVLTAVIAYRAAKKAYLGAIKQAEAVQEQTKLTLEIFEKNEAKEISGAAMALMAEMNYWIVTMVGVWEQAQNKKATALYRLSRKNVRFQIFDSNPRALASADPLTVADIVAFYVSLEEQIEILKDGFEHIKKDKENDGHFQSVIETTRYIILMGDRAVRKLQSETGLPYYSLPQRTMNAIQEASRLESNV
ncbi:hypothetical protein [Thalassospira xiamenensis]|uniref:Uncharacterized protein n=1 Tax=Thalassospira xiamenensis TaxID=220697 RepID=A0A367WSG0_9PROT|nr:hypothetical protein [Thalassospira xiamenensis]KZB50780.1 hypothetical protein AUP41_09715 [Thalassospira xiamenensis]RCK44405.1 hypothetical protein TH44_22605 [Thalassospira xiamenensis]